MMAVATIASKRDLALVRVLATSFQQHHTDVPFVVLLTDEVDGHFDPSSEPFRLVRLEELGIPNLPRFRFHYTQQELMYAATPYLLSHLLERGLTRVAYLKQESLVVGDLTPVLRLLDQHPIVLTPHLLTPLSGADGIERELNILQSGVYNVGFLGVSSTPVARAFLRWWQDRLFEHCRHDVPAGMHFEQRWLDLVPAFFEDVHVVRDPGFNVGHWNLPERQVALRGDAYTVDGEPCRFIRFSGFDPDHPGAVTRYYARLTMDNIGVAAGLFRRYVALLEAAGYHETKAWPYAYDRFDNGEPVTDECRQMYRELGPEADRFGDPLSTASSGCFLRWLERRRVVRDRLRRWVRRAHLDRVVRHRRAAGLVALVQKVLRI
jgi:hypothetical protein